MRESGYSAEDALSLDVAFVSFVRRFRNERDATVSKWVKAEKPPHKGQVRAIQPKHERDELLRMLGIDPGLVEEDRTLGALAAAAGLDAATWEALPDYPDEEGSE